MATRSLTDSGSNGSGEGPVPTAAAAVPVDPASEPAATDEAGDGTASGLSCDQAASLESTSFDNNAATESPDSPRAARGSAAAEEVVPARGPRPDEPATTGVETDCTYSR